MPRAWLLHSYSGYQSLTLEDVPLEEPGDGEVRLRVEAFALNWGDIDLMWDHHSFSFPKLPARVGIEAAGIVDAIGPGVEGIELGERMCTLPYFYYNRGASTESLVIDACYVTKAPPSLSAAESASVWMQYMTAYFPLAEISRVGQGDFVLATAATGTAGSAALQIGCILGATMIGTTRFEHNRSYLEELGADHVIVTGEGNLAEELDGITDSKGVNAAFDPVGASLIGRYSPALARDARIFFYGTLDEEFPSLPIVDMLQRNVIFHPYSLFNYVENREMCEKGKAFTYEMLASGRLAPHIDRIYPMEQYREAFDYLSRPRENHGKVIIKTGL
jgi:NADPH:quinone reductase-like Zn-dependent oxidoreductase